MALYLAVASGSQLAANLAKLKAAGPVIVAHALREEAEELMTRIKERYVPVRDGHLRDSGIVDDAKITNAGTGPIISVRFGFGGSAAPYAKVVHENPRSGKTGGVSPSGRRYKKWAKVGRWKYVRDPLDHLGKRLTARLAARIKREWGALLG